MTLLESIPKLERRYTYPLLLVPIGALVLLVNVTDAVALASRVFALYFVLQCIVAIWLARRNGEWFRLLAFVAIGLIMSTIAVFGLPV